MSYPTYSTNNGVGITDPTGDKQIGVGINGLVLTTGLLTTPTTTIISPSGFDTGGQQVSFTNLYNLKQATPALRIPATTNVYVVNNTYEANDDNLAKTRIASMSAIATLDPKLTLKADTGGAVWEEADLTQNTLTYIESNTTTHIKPLIELVNSIPTYVLSGNSNLPVGIPVYTNNHQIVLQSTPVPLIDTLVPTIYSIPSGDTPLCYCWTGSYLYMGTENGEVYLFNGSNWTSVITFDGAVRCLYYHSPQGRLYIGGRFGNINAPYSQTGLNSVCWSSNFPYLSSVGVDVWNNYGINGFDKAVNAITADSSFMYFGGDFDYIYGGGLNCKKLACYDWSNTQFIFCADGGSGNGFDNPIWSLAIANQSLCCCGEFNNLQINSGSNSVNYCCSIYFNSGYVVGSVDYLYGNPTALNQKITTLDAVQTDGNTFYISTDDANIAGNGANYLIQTPNYSFPSVSSIGNNAYATRQTSWNRNGGICSVGGNSEYLINGEVKATLPFTPFIYWNSFYGRQEFIDLGSGQIYAFTGSIENNFVLQGGRTIISTGNTFTGGWKINTNSGNGYGYCISLFWNGAYYTHIGVPYGSGYN